MHPNKEVNTVVKIHGYGSLTVAKIVIWLKVNSLAKYFLWIYNGNKQHSLLPL